MSVVIHMGMSKAGSTTLQRSVFPLHRDIFYYGKDLSCGKGSSPYPTTASQNLTLGLVNLDRFDGVSSDLITSVDEDRQAAEEQGKLFVFSNEHLCESVCPAYQCEILKEVFKDPYVLLIIRSQFSMLLSHYKFAGMNLRFVPGRYKKKFVSFDEYFEFLMENFRNRGGHKARDWVGDYLRIIDFNKFISINERAFGSERVIVVPFERMITDPSVLFQAIQDKTGFKFSYTNMDLPRENESIPLSGRGFFWLDMLSRLPGGEVAKGVARQFARPLHRMVSRGGSNLELTPQARKAVSELYADGNKMIAKRYDLNLRSLGYPT